MAKEMSSAPLDPTLQVYEPQEAPPPLLESVQAWPAMQCECHKWCGDLVLMAVLGHHPNCPLVKKLSSKS